MENWSNFLRKLEQLRDSPNVHSVRDFPQDKLDSEINARFLSNEHGDLYLLLHEFGVTTILFKLKSSQIILVMFN